MALAGLVRAIPLPAVSITIGEPAHVPQPEQVQVKTSTSPPNLRHLLMKARLQLVVVVGQQRPEAFREVPVGQVPSNFGVVQVPEVAGRLHVKCSTLTSRHMLPPVTVAAADAIRRLKETLALVPQLVPMKQDEKDTPVAEAQEMLVPSGPVRFSVFWSFVPMCEKKGVMFESVPLSKAAKLRISTEHR